MVTGYGSEDAAKLRAIGRALCYFEYDISEVDVGPKHPALVEIKVRKIEIDNRNMPWSVINYIMYTQVLGQKYDGSIGRWTVPVELTDVDPKYLVDEWNVLKVLRSKGFKVKITGGPIQRDEDRPWLIEVTKPKDRSFVPIECKGSAYVDRSSILCVAGVAAMGIEIAQPECYESDLLKEIVPEGVEERDFLRTHGVY